MASRHTADEEARAEVDVLNSRLGEDDPIDQEDPGVLGQARGIREECTGRSRVH